MKFFRVACLLVLVFVLACAALAQDNAQKQPLPNADGGLGECSLTVTTVDGHGKPVGRAKVELSAQYGGFLSKHDLDLTVYTNPKGKAIFQGLPDKVDGVAFVRASNGTLKGIAVYDPGNACEKKHDIIMTPGLPSETADTE